MKKKQPTKKIPNSVNPNDNVVYKHQMTYRHDLIKLKPEVMLKNMSYKLYQPKIVKMEHCHMYHSHNKQGKRNQYTSATGGHFHEVTYHEDGSITFGPPLEKIVKKTRSGRTKRVIQQVHFLKDASDDESEEMQKIVDNHTHEPEYLGSEDLSLHQKMNPEAAKVMSQSLEHNRPSTTVRDPSTGEELARIKDNA